MTNNEWSRDLMLLKFRPDSGPLAISQPTGVDQLRAPMLPGTRAASPSPTVATSPGCLQCTWCDHSQRCRSQESYIWINWDNIATQNKVKFIVCWIKVIQTRINKNGWKGLFNWRAAKKTSNNMSIKTIIQNALDKVGSRENSDKITFDAKCKLHSKWNINSTFINKEKGIKKYVQGKGYFESSSLNDFIKAICMYIFTYLLSIPTCT